MASVTILSDNGATSGSAGLKTSGGNDGVLLLQTTTSGGTPTTAISISNTQVVTYTNQPTYTGGTANGVLYLNGSKAVTSGTALVFDGSNLGLGVTLSGWGGGASKVLEFGNAGSSLWSSTAGATQLSSAAYYNGGWKYANSSTRAAYYEQYLGGHYWYTAASGTAGNAITFTQAMTLDASGNLGVGVTTVGQKLEIGSSGTVYAKISSSTNSSFRGVQFGINGDSNTYGAVAMEVNGGELRTTAGFGGWGGYQTFYTNGSERARIDTSGNFLLGQTSTPGTASGLTLGANALLFLTSSSSPTSNIGGGFAMTGQISSPVCGRVFIGDNTGWQWEWGPYGVSGWVRRFYFTDGGAAYSTTGTWGTISDARLKENIVDATPKLSDVMRLRVRNFNFITEPNNKQLGFIAQEVEEVFPRAVDETRPDDDGNTTKSVKTTVLIPILVKAIQELKAEVDALKGQA